MNVSGSIICTPQQGKVHSDLTGDERKYYLGRTRVAGKTDPPEVRRPTSTTTTTPTPAQDSTASTTPTSQEDSSPIAQEDSGTTPTTPTTTSSSSTAAAGASPPCYFNESGIPQVLITSGRQRFGDTRTMKMYDLQTEDLQAFQK